MRNSVLIILSLLFIINGCAQNKSDPDRRVGSPCEDCDLMFKGIPSVLNWKTQISPVNEPGEILTMTGTIYKKDGRTPAPGVILYVYQTDNKGHYSPDAKQVHARRHGHLRGWVKTGADGKYEFKTIRPGAYPERNNPQHIHPIVKEEGLSEYWIDEYLFDDDPLLTEEERKRQEKRGGNGIIKLKKNAKGEWIGERNIVLGLNIPNY